MKEEKLIMNLQITLIIYEKLFLSLEFLSFHFNLNRDADSYFDEKNF